MSDTVPPANEGPGEHYPGHHAETRPDRIAVAIAETGETLTYRELEDASRRIAQLLHARGLRPGGHVAVLMENNLAFLTVVWAAQRSGLHYTCISARLTAPEAAYIVGDCGATAFVTSSSMGAVAREVVAGLGSSAPATLLASGGGVEGFDTLEEAAASRPAEPLAEETEGADMLYSSGTTGRPKGVKLKLPGVAIGRSAGLGTLWRALYKMTPDSVYLCPAPLYHAAPLRFAMGAQRVGATVVVMQRFEEHAFLDAVERHRVTHTQVVPTMMIRLLRLPEAERTRRDLSSLTCLIHAAAPCPIPVKEQMIEWLGPVVYEYYAGTEGNGFVAIDSAQWLEHKGSVGKPLGAKVHILDDDGKELGPGEAGTVYFETPGAFEYHNDPDKTRASRSAQGFSTLGDVGYLDEDGFLYLTDRKAYMIISGGVNIYPQEAENVLATHPKVGDVAVFGVPNEEFGEEVKAVVEPAPGAEPGPGLEAELLEFCRSQLAAIKCPRSVDFEAELPRHPNGKLYKRLLKDRYWSGHTSRIV